MPLYARFHEEDADEIDPDFHLNTETWNDKNSYRWSSFWRQQWEKSHSGYRVSAGSLNATRFNFDDELKLDPISLKPVSLAYNQQRREDYTEAQIEREVRVGIKVLEPLRILILGDTTSLKEYGDVGLGVRLFESTSHHTDFYYLSMDHYYNEKSHEEGSFRNSLTRTWGVKSYQQPALHGFGWELKLENDLPFRWHRPTRGDYHYQRLQGNGRVSYQSQTHSTLYLSANYDVKEEGYKTINDSPQTHLTLNRHAAILELGIESQTSQSRYTFGVQSVDRRTKWDKSGDPELQKQWSEEIPPNSSVRREWGLLFSDERDVSNSIQFIQGLYVNDVHIKEDRDRWDVVEIKYQTALSWIFSSEANFGLNATWDLDQIARDFPYRSKSFNPWGGGNIQAQIAF